MESPNREQRQRNEALRARLIASGALDLDSLCAVRNDPDTAATVRWLEQQRDGVLVAESSGARYYPAFQFTPDGRLRPELEDHIRVLQTAGLGPWQTWAWLTTTATLLSGDVPAEVLVTNPVRGAKAVERFAARVRGGSREA